MEDTLDARSNVLHDSGGHGVNTHRPLHVWVVGSTYNECNPSFFATTDFVYEHFAILNTSLNRWHKCNIGFSTSVTMDVVAHLVERVHAPTFSMQIRPTTTTTKKMSSLGRAISCIAAAMNTFFALLQRMNL